MYNLCFFIVIYCAFCPRGSAAPRTWVADPRSQPPSEAEQNDMLQEEMDTHENILSKVRENVLFFNINGIYFIIPNERDGKHPSFSLRSCWVIMTK